jgi:hypothetical protein
MGFDNRRRSQTAYQAITSTSKVQTAQIHFEHKISFIVVQSSSKEEKEKLEGTIPKQESKLSPPQAIKSLPKVGRLFVSSQKILALLS